MSLIVPAVLPSSRKDLKEKIMLFASLLSVSRVQIDVVDGKFASPTSWPYTDTVDSPKVAQKELRDMLARDGMLPHLHRITYEIDLMCLDPERAIEEWLALGASRFTVHVESSTHASRLIAAVRRRHGASDAAMRDLIKIGLALNIETDNLLVEHCLGDIDYVQFMGIASIGKQGQPFDRRVLAKIRAFHKKHPTIALQVDGGVSLETAPELLAAGASSLISGSAILRAADPAAAVAKFEALQSPYGV